MMKNIPIGDKNKIQQLLKKPWNPYIRRHTGLTEKSKMIHEHPLRQYVGWSQKWQSSDNGYGAIGNDGFHYTLAIHKSARLLLFAKIAKKTTEAQMGGHCIWFDAHSNGRYQILDQDHAAEVKLIPTGFVPGKYSQAMYYFSICEDVKNSKKVTRI